MSQYKPSHDSDIDQLGQEEIKRDLLEFPHLHFAIPYGVGRSPLAHSGALPFFGLEASLNIGDPVHETITQQALREVGLIGPRVSYTAPKAWEYTRGTFWNDDPECLLFRADDQVSNYSLRGTAQFGIAFQTIRRSLKEQPPGLDARLLARSHYGDLQFLHAMACSDGEDARTTLNWILEWAEFTYRIAQRPECAKERLCDVTAGNLSRRFPTEQRSVAQVFGVHGEGRVGERALGSLLHLIQDSHAAGHTERHSDGRILEFHSYINQDSGRHAEKDKFVEGKLESTPGALNAVKACVAVLQMYKRAAPWAELLILLRDSIFELSTHARTSSAGAQFQVQR